MGFWVNGIGLKAWDLGFGVCFWGCAHPQGGARGFTEGWGLRVYHETLRPMSESPTSFIPQSPVAFRVSGLGFRVSGLGFRVLSSGSRI